MVSGLHGQDLRHVYLMESVVDLESKIKQDLVLTRLHQVVVQNA